MGVQSNVNAAIGTLATAAAISEHLKQQQLQTQKQGLEEWTNIENEAKEIHSEIQDEKNNIEIEKESQEEVKNMDYTHFRNDKGQFVTDEEINNYKNEFIAKSEEAMQKSKDIIDAKQFQMNKLQERINLSDKMMGKKVVKDFMNKGLTDPETHDVIMDIKKGQYQPYKDYKGGNK